MISLNNVEASRCAILEINSVPDVFIYKKDKFNNISNIVHTTVVANFKSIPKPADSNLVAMFTFFQGWAMNYEGKVCSEDYDVALIKDGLNYYIIPQDVDNNINDFYKNNDKDLKKSVIKYIKNKYKVDKNKIQHILDYYQLN
jgi:hypothetical protein